MPQLNLLPSKVYCCPQKSTLLQVNPQQAPGVACIMKPQKHKPGNGVNSEFKILFILKDLEEVASERTK